MITYQLQINRLITQIACKNSYCDHFYHNQSTLPHSPPASKDFARPLTLVYLLSLTAPLLEQDQSRSQMVSNRGLYSERKVCVCACVGKCMRMGCVLHVCAFLPLALSFARQQNPRYYPANGWYFQRPSSRRGVAATLYRGCHSRALFSQVEYAYAHHTVCSRRIETRNRTVVGVGIGLSCFREIYFLSVSMMFLEVP